MEKILVIGAGKNELLPGSRIVKFIKNLQLDQIKNERLEYTGFNDINPKGLPQPVFINYMDRKEIILRYINDNKQYYNDNEENYNKYKNKFNFIMLDRSTQHSTNMPISNYPQNKQDWDTWKKNGELYDYKTHKFKLDIEEEVDYIQMMYMLNKFLKPGGCFICPQNKLYNDILYKNLFYSYRHLTNDEFKLLEENTNLNIEYNWYLYYDYKNIITDYKNDITDYKNIITVKLFNQEPTPLVSIWNRDYEQLLPYNDKVTTINTEDDQIKTVFNDLKKNSKLMNKYIMLKLLI